MNKMDKKQNVESTGVLHALLKELSRGILASYKITFTLKET